MTTIVFHQGDAYEIFFTSKGVDSIVRYRGCRDGRGEPVDCNTISAELRRKIQEQLVKSQKKLKREFRVKAKKRLLNNLLAGDAEGEDDA
jgi:hypothetical protein